MSKKVIKLERYSPSLPEAIDLFIYWKQAQGLSTTTIKDYRGHVNSFFKRFPETFEDETKLKKYLLEYMSQPVKPATYNLRLTYLKVFFQWCVEEGI